MEVAIGWFLIVLSATGLFFWLRPHYRRRRTWRKHRGGFGGSRLKTTIEEARGIGLQIGWEDISVDRLARKKEAQEQVEILCQPEIPFVEVQRLAKSEQVGVSALGLAAIARRDDIPVEWTTQAARLLGSCTNELEPFIYETC
jgi:hypothetical protein